MCRQRLLVAERLLAYSLVGVVLPCPWQVLGAHHLTGKGARVRARLAADHTNRYAVAVRIGGTAAFAAQCKMHLSRAATGVMGTRMHQGHQHGIIMIVETL